MNCPVCNRNNAVSLSVCPSCGTMVNDSVRAGAVSKVYPVAKPVNADAKSDFKLLDQVEKTISPADFQEPNRAKSGTSSLSTKLTSPTLVEFHTASAAVPEWRLQLQNTVRQRHERIQNPAEKAISSTPRQPNLVTNGATALKIEPLAEIIEPKIARNGNPKLASALQRIENSRQKFLIEEEEAVVVEASALPVTATAKTNKNFPFYIASKTNEADVQTSANSIVKPTLAASLRTETKDLDTQKSPPLPTTAKVETKFEVKPTISLREEAKVEEKRKVVPEIIHGKEVIQEVQPEVEDDCAPFAMRFNAGLFDLIIGSFLSLILLSPFILSSEGWGSIAGILAFLATCAVVMFTYLTTTISMHGKTFGMRLFSLELVDIEGEHYPTLHQAAVSSAVYLLSLACGGIGFLTLPFNEDKRAIHDIVSGTIILREE